MNGDRAARSAGLPAHFVNAVNERLFETAIPFRVVREGRRPVGFAVHESLNLSRSVAPGRSPLNVER